MSKQSPYELEILTVIVLFLLFGVCWFMWYFFHEELTNIVRWVRVTEMWLVSLFVKDFVINVPELGVQHLKIWREWMPRANVNDIGFPEMKATTFVAVWPLRPFFAAVMGAMAVWVIYNGPGTKYKRKLTVETLIQEQAKAFPVIAPFVKFNPMKVPPRVLGHAVPSQLPMFAEALSPEEWVAFHEIKYSAGQLDPNRAWGALGLQLGKRWEGPDNLALHTQGLYAVFALKHARKRKDAEELLNELALSWDAEKGMNMPPLLRAKIRKIIKDPKIGGELQKFADQHAFETTAMLRCLQRAREEGGVLAPATFLWLRGVDRTLWYPLNNLGRKSYHAEAVGAMVHYTHELIASQKIPAPRFEEVIKGLENMLRGPGARAIPPLEKKAV